MSLLVISFIVTAFAILALLRWDHLHAKITADHDLHGVQKFHAIPVARVGGLGIFVGLVAALLLRAIQNPEATALAMPLIGASLPAFVAGLVEDVTKRVRAFLRLLSAIVSAMIAGYWLDAWVVNFGVPGSQEVLSALPWLSIALTCFAVAGLTNAFNLIDGYNGLSSVVACIILLGISYVAFQVQDVPVLVGCLAMVGAILGFVLWNYPRGLIFLGDGGAYLIGFWVSEMALLITVRNESVSPWFALLICFYPVFETVFTIYRRALIRKTHIGMPDALHLHQIIYRRVVRWAIGSGASSDKTVRNSLTAPYLWFVSSLAVIPATLFWNQPIVLMIFVGMFVYFYVGLYRRIVRFRAPEWIILRKKT